ncbi:MAG: winged helix DNA-binding domain-containing protein [Thermomicrobia bacterium]|nr:winged helix DNA-binding domain-containing protein [Thermomicrobia bacterium]
MMTKSAIAQQRLYNQRIAGTEFTTPQAVVQWLGAVQSQDYAGAKWAVGQRTHGATDAALDAAFAAGTILRTHVMRPTWHFVAPADIRWLLAFTAPRVKALNAYYDRTLALDDAIFARSNTALRNALQGGAQRTRAELAAVLQQAGIATDELRLVHLVMRAELDGLVCSGARRGKQFTYALLDERVPHAETLSHNEALAALTMRYMTSHGPASVQDFVWWSGLTMTDANAGVAMVKSHLLHETVDDRTYWFAASAPIANNPSPAAYLLPNFDEYIVGYTDRRAALDAPPADQLDARGNVLFNHTIVMDGQVVGTWKRTLKKDAVAVDATPFAPLDTAQTAALEVAVARYGQFVGLPAVVRISH